MEAAAQHKDCSWSWRLACASAAYCLLLSLLCALPGWLVVGVALCGAALLTADLQRLRSLSAPVTQPWLEALPEWSLAKLVLPALRGKLAALWSGKNKTDLTVSVSSPGLVASSLERRFVWSWYSRWVSEEIAFPFACKELLDGVVSKGFQVSLEVDSVRLASDLLLVVLKHCKEYKRSVRLKAKNPDGPSVADLYRRSHPTSGADSLRSKSPRGHCSALIGSLLKESLPWELWGTPPADVLRSILADRLECFVSSHLSDPIRLKSEIRAVVSGEAPVASVDRPLRPEPTEEKSRTPVEDRPKSEPSKESARTNVSDPSPATVEIAAKAEECPSAFANRSGSDRLDGAAPALRPRDRRAVDGVPNDARESGPSPGVPIAKSRPLEIARNRSPGRLSPRVKVHDRIVEGSVKTWSDEDLECVSLGRDLLASMGDEIDFGSRPGRLWEADAPETWSPGAPPADPSDGNSCALWFGEDDNLDGDSTEESPPRNTDEAAGMMEGILDFGMAGLRKGLRLTGLQESPQDKVSLPTIVKEAESSLVQTLDKVLSTSRKNSQTDETALKLDSDKVVDPVEKSPNNGGNVLVKQNRVVSQDSTVEQASKSSNLESANSKGDELHVPIILDSLESESPDYEYEETADFASTIAKLRCLLQQKTGDTTPVCPEQNGLGFLPPKSDSSDECQNTNAKQKSETGSMSSFDSETGFTVFTNQIPELIEAEEALHHKSGSSSLFGSSSNISQGANTNNMQRLDKLFTRTVTGVFNTIKTAVGGDSSSDIIPGQADGLSHVERQKAKEEYKEDWIYIESDVDLSIAISRLLMERRGFCVVEAGQDSLEILSGPKTPSEGSNPSKRTIVTDDFEESELISSCPLWHMCTEIVALSLEGAFQKDIIVKITSVAVADIMETKLEAFLDEFSGWLREKIIKGLQGLSAGINDTYIKTPEKEPSPPSSQKEVEEPLNDVESEVICDAILKHIPDFVIKVLGRREIREAVKFIISSIENQSINKDLMYNLLDVLVAHFLRASSQQQPTWTPPPSVGYDN